MFTNQHASRIVYESTSDVDLWTMLTNTLLNKEIIKIKVIDSEEFNNFYVHNFYVHNFYCWNHLRFQNLVWSCHLVKFKISTVQIWSNENIIKIKVVYIDELYNFGIHEFFIWNHLLFQNIVSSWNYLNFKIWIVQTKSHDKMTKIKLYMLMSYTTFMFTTFSFYFI